MEQFRKYSKLCNKTYIDSFYWKRPESVTYPKIWSKFVGKKYLNMKPLEYQIQDLTENLVESVINHMTSYFLVREKMCSITGFSEEKESIENIQVLWRDILRQRCGLVALVTNDKSKEQQLAGISINLVTHKSETLNLKFEGAAMMKIWKALMDLSTPIEVFKRFNTDIYMTGLGLSVAPRYYGENIGRELLLARNKLCLAVGVPLIISTFTGPASQHVASETGFKEVSELKFETYEQHGKIAFPNLTGRMLLMAKECNQNYNS